MYIYIHLFITLINIVPEKNEKKKKKIKVVQYFSNFISYSNLFLANCKLNHTLFWCIWGVCPNLRKLLKHVS